MKISIYNIITELCSNLGKEIIDKNCDRSCQEKIVKRLRSYAFEILLTKRDEQRRDVTEEDSGMLVVDVTSHIYWSAKARGEWTEEMNNNIYVLVEKVEALVKNDASSLLVLKLLLCLADSVPPPVYFEEPSYGLDMKTLITDNGLKHRSLVKANPSFFSEIFELPAASPSLYDKFPDVHVFNDTPGAGLKHKEFFTITTKYRLPSSFAIKDIDEYDLTNANWIFPKLQNINLDVSNISNVSRIGMHQDEGYVTPDQDLKIMRSQESPYIPWENMYERLFKPVYSWENFGSAFPKKECAFISQEREAMQHIWKVVHAFNFTSSTDSSSVSIALKTISLEELEVAFKNLLVGIESNIFHYSQAKRSFTLQEGLYLNGSAARTLEDYCRGFIECGNCFRDLSLVTQKTSESALSRTRGTLIYQALCSNIVRYLQCYRGIVLRMPPLQSLLHTNDWLYNLRTHLQFLVSLCQIEKSSSGESILAHLYNQVPLVTRSDLAFILYYILQTCCTVYFGFLKKWIFEGICDCSKKEFFIELRALPDAMYYSRKLWTRGFFLDKEHVPGFLKGLEGDIFVCGKSMALLKLCSPDDPVCLGIKHGYPGVLCCLNKTHIEEVEEQCQQYKERCEAHCHERFGNNIPETQKDEDYYAAVRAKTLDKIKQVQEEEKRLRTEKKRIEFDLLKKCMEDARAQKEEYKKNILIEEEKILEEAEKIDHLNDLRREEEREKLEQYYSAISDAADRRRDKAEWKIKRAQLHEKRIEFLKTTENIEYFENSIKTTNQLTPLEINTPKEGYLGKSKDKTEELCASMPGSGDYVTSLTGHRLQALNSDLTDHTEDQSLEINLNIKKDHLIPNIEPITNRKNHIKYKNELNNEERDWLIALDVADQARQSALKFKERNMFNDYNILTGEVTTFQSRFGEKLQSDDIREVPKKYFSKFTDSEEASIKSVINDKEYIYSDNEDTPTTIEENNSCNHSITSEMLPSEYNENTFNIKAESPSKIKSEEVKMKSEEDIRKPPLVCHSVLNNTIDKLETSFSSKSHLNVNEIDMTTVYQNLRMSVMIPLSTQLELANKAVLRLFFGKHEFLKHVECIRKYFFLLDGEFGRNLTRKLFSEIQLVEHPCYLLNVSDLNALLRSAVGTAVDEEFTERLSFFVKEIPPVFRLIDPLTLDCLSLRYRTHWPLNVIITEEAIIKCDKVFRFLIQLQRTTWALQEDAYLLKDRRLLDSQQYRQVQLYRHIMTHFVTTLNTYVTSVVLEESWFKFKEELPKVKTLNEIYAAHVDYIKMLLFRCLLNKRSKTVNGHLVELFGIILTFHEVLRSGEWVEDTTGYYQHPGFPRLAHQFDSFLQLSRFLYKYLERLVSVGYQPHLVQLLTLLSANNFYSDEA